MAGLSFVFLNVATLCVANSRMTKNSTPMPMRPTAINAPIESLPARPWVASNMSLRVAQRLNKGTRPMPVAETSMAMVPRPNFISYPPCPVPFEGAADVFFPSAIGPP